MRTCTDAPGLKAAVLSAAQKPYAAFTSEDPLWRWVLVGSGGRSGTMLTVPTQLGRRTSDGSLFFSGFNGDGKLFFKGLTPASADFTSTSPVWSSPHDATGGCALTAGFDGSYFYPATWTWGANPILYKLNYDGTTAETWNSNQIPEVMEDGALLVRRVEAVIPIAPTYDRVLVAIGAHHFDTRRSTLSFYLGDSSGWEKLQSTLQVPMKETETYIAWHSACRYCANVCALWVDDQLILVANDQPFGRPTLITRRNSVEARRGAIIPSDPDATDIGFTPTGLCTINELHYLSGFFRRPKSDGTVDRLNGFLTSSDGISWSVGERNSFVCNGSVCGALLPASPYVYFAGPSTGGSQVWRAPYRVLDGVGAASDITESILRFTIDQMTDAADQLSIQATAAPPDGRVIQATLGYDVVSGGSPRTVEMGAYLVDQAPATLTVAGPQGSDFTCLDWGSRILKDWRSPVDIDRWSRTAHLDDLNTFGMLVTKTPLRDAIVQSAAMRRNPSVTAPKAVKVTDGSLYSSALNDPFVGYSPDRDPRDLLIQAEVELGGSNGRCLPSVGLIFGGSSANFNALVFPGDSIWTGHTVDRPQLRQAHLAEVDEETGEGGFNTDPRVIGILEGVLGEVSKITWPYAGTASASAVSYCPNPYVLATGCTTQVAMAQMGDRVFAWAKEKDYTPAQVASHAAWTCLGEWTMNEWGTFSHDPRPYAGLIAGTDVPASTDWFTQSAYGDMDVGITEADNGLPTQDLVYDVYLAGGGPDGDAATDTLVVDYVHPFIQVGAVIWVQLVHKWGTPEVGNDRDMSVWYPGCQVEAIDGNKITFTAPCIYNNPNAGLPTRAVDHYHLWGPRNAPGAYGYAYSGYEAYTIYDSDGVTALNIATSDSGGSRHGTLVRGKAIFINDGSDSTAAAGRWITSNGSLHLIESDNGLGTAWDDTSPRTDPRLWSMKMNHGCFFVGDPAIYGLPNDGYFKVDDEIIRFTTITFEGVDGSHTWVVVPTYYSVLRRSDGPTYVLRNWACPTAGPNLNNKPGDDFYYDIPNGTGLLAEIRTRTQSTEITPSEEEIVYRVAAQVPYQGAEPTYDDVSSVTLDHEWESAITEPTQYNTEINPDYVVISGRAQLETAKALHDSTAPVVYYPLDLTTPPPAEPLDWFVRVGYLDHFNGVYNSVQDDLAYTCALSGVRPVTFRPIGTWAGALDTTPRTVSGTESVADFVLDVETTLTTSGSFVVTFRGGAYDLALNVTSWRSADRAITLILSAPLDTQITPSGGVNLLESVQVPIGLSTLTDDTLHLRVVAKGDLISVEAEGTPVWTFNLARMSYLDGATEKFYRDHAVAGAVTIWRTESAQTTMASCQELAGEVENHIIDMGGVGAEAIGFVLENRHIWSRSTPEGGIEFSQFRTRDDWSADTIPLEANTFEEQTVEGALDLPGHVLMSGAEFGEYLDDDWVREHGYTFQMGQNQLLNSVQDSRVEAKLLVRLGQEQEKSYTIVTVGIPDLQPEDLITVQRYAPNDPLGAIDPISGTIPRLDPVDLVVDQINLTGQPGEFTMRLVGRVDTGEVWI